MLTVVAENELTKFGRQTVFLQLVDKKSIKELYINMFFPRAGADSRSVMLTQWIGDNLLGYHNSAVLSYMPWPSAY